MGANEKLGYYTKLIAENLSEIMETQELAQIDIVERGHQKNISLGSATVSKLLKGEDNITLKTLIQLSMVLEVPLLRLLEEKCVFDGKDNEMLIENSYHRAFKGYKGNYHVYFFPTEKNSRDNELLHAVMKTEEEGELVKVKFILYTGQFKDGKQITKEYQGNMIISLSVNAVYFQLKSEAEGEYCFLIIHHFFLNHNELDTCLGVAITSSSGEDKRPTMQRICLTRREMEKEKQEKLAGFLRLGDTKLFMYKRDYDALIRHNIFSKEFLDVLEQIKVEDTIYEFEEKLLLKEINGNKEFIKQYGVMKNYIIGDKFDKISSENNEIVYQMFRENETNS